MKQVNIRELKANLSKYLRDLPLEITNHGRPIAWLIEPGEETLTPSANFVATPLGNKPKINLVSEPEQFVANAVEEKKKLPFNGGPCFHKALPGMCKIDWCPNRGGKK